MNSILYWKRTNWDEEYIRCKLLLFSLAFKFYLLRNQVTVIINHSYNWLQFIVCFDNSIICKSVWRDDDNWWQWWTFLFFNFLDGRRRGCWRRWTNSFLPFVFRIYGRRIARRNYIEFIVELLAAAAVRVPMMMPGIAVVVAFRIVPNWLVDCWDNKPELPVVLFMSPLLEMEVIVCSSFSLRTTKRRKEREKIK